MKHSDITKIICDLSKDIDEIKDNKVKKIQSTLLNLIEALASENDVLRTKVQQQRNEINRLKGEQGKPKIRPQKKDNDDDKPNSNHSSEKNRKPSGEKPRKPKPKKNIAIDRHENVSIDLDALPADAEFKGFEYTVLQDIKITTDNVKFKRVVYYSQSLKKTFIAPLPEGYSGGFGPQIRALILSLYQDCNMSEPAILRFLRTFKIDISNATVSRLRTKNLDIFHQEKEDIVNAGINSTPYQHLDDTGAREAGKNRYVHVLCNPYYTAYFTTPKKDRLTILEVLSCGTLNFTFSEESYQLMTELGLSKKCLSELQSLHPADLMSREELDVLLKKLFPNPKKHQGNRRIISEGSGIVNYRHSDLAITFLNCDDAPQFNKITLHKSLCWVHEGRHFKKLNPVTPTHREVLDKFIDKFWRYYKKLLGYKEKPTITAAKQLQASFDKLFSTKTGYDALDDRIEKTYAKKIALLLVLEFPFLPLHNNPAELGARVQARRRDVSLQTKNEAGTKAKDTMATITETARKLKVNVFDYVYDRVTKKFKLNSLAKIISQKGLEASQTFAW